MATCHQCGKSTASPYVDNKRAYCSECWEDKQRHDGRDALYHGYDKARERRESYNDQQTSREHREQWPGTWPARGE